MTGLASIFTSGLTSTRGASVLGSGAIAAGAVLLALGLVVTPLALGARGAAAAAGGASDFAISALGVDSAGGAASAALGAASGLTAVSVDGFVGASVSEGCAPTDCGFSRSFAKVPSLPGHLWPRQALFLHHPLDRVWRLLLYATHAG